MFRPVWKVAHDPSVIVRPAMNQSQRPADSSTMKGTHGDARLFTVPFPRILTPLQEDTACSARLESSVTAAALHASAPVELPRRISISERKRSAEETIEEAEESRVEGMGASKSLLSFRLAGRCMSSRGQLANTRHRRMEGGRGSIGPWSGRCRDKW